MTQTILAIDDSEDTHRLLDVRLRRDGIHLDHALTAQDGLRLARQLLPDLVLLDLDMPDITGFEVCIALKADPSTAAIPIIFLTAASDTFNKVRGFDLGAVDFVTKPFDSAELKARVRAALRTKRYQDLLANRADVDALTGLWNRGYFDRRLKEELAAHLRYQRDVTLVVMDIDHFKAINDGHGHPFGDQVLERLGSLLRGGSRTTDAACRCGGDEFALILPETTLAEGSAFAQRLCAQVAAISLHGNEGPVVVTASIGVAAADSGNGIGTPEELIRAADDALYQAKRGGRNGVRTRLVREQQNTAEPEVP